MKIPSPPGKIPSDAHAHKQVKLHHFCEKLCCITPSDKTVQQHINTNAVSNHKRETDCARCILQKNYEILPNYK